MSKAKRGRDFGSLRSWLGRFVARIEQVCKRLKRVEGTSFRVQMHLV